MRLALALCLVLAGCSTSRGGETGLARSASIPELPPELAIKAEQLPPLTTNTMGGLQVQGSIDDATYNSVAFRLNDVIDIYNCVRDSYNSGKDINQCQLKQH